MAKDVFGRSQLIPKDLDYHPEYVGSSRLGKELLEEYRGYDDEQKEAFIESLTRDDIQILQGQLLTSDEQKHILDIIDPLPSDGL